jgi:hypothetical protein
MSKKPRLSPTPRDRAVDILTNPKLPRRLHLTDGRTVRRRGLPMYSCRHFGFDGYALGSGQFQPFL